MTSSFCALRWAAHDSSSVHFAGAAAGRYIAPMEQLRRRPKILVADDDPVSLRFLAAALGELGCAPTAVTSGGAAIEASLQTRHDLMLLDRRMPDLGGADLLRAMRDRRIGTPALATSAELDASQRAALLDAGYADALAKPLALDGLARALAACMPGWRDPRAEGVPADTRSAPPRAMPLPLLDDAAGLASAGGDAATLGALRGLLAGELGELIERMAAQSLTSPALGERLHRLRAACRYCGTPQLGATAARLESALARPMPPTRAQVEEFIEACARTRAALAAQAPPDPA